VFQRRYILLPGVSSYADLHCREMDDGQTRRRCLSAKFIDQRVGSTERDANGKEGVKAQPTSVVSVLGSDIEILIG